MRKLLLPMLLIGVAFVSCQKPSGNTTYPENLTKQISVIGKKYQSSHGLAQKIDKAKAVKLAIADGVGAVVVGGGAWARLWGGFLTTLALEPYLRTRKVGQIYVIPPDSSNYFTDGNIGDYHNDLMKQALEANLYATVYNDQINDSLQSLLIENNFFSISDISDTLENNENNLVGAITYVESYADTMDLNVDGLIGNMPQSDNVKEAISSIYEQLLEIDPGSISSFLLDVERTVINSSSLSTIEKNQLFVFIGVENSSVHFWLANE